MSELNPIAKLILECFEESVPFKDYIDDKKEVPLEHQFSGIEKDAVSDNHKTTADNSTTVNNEFKRFKGF